MGILSFLQDLDQPVAFDIGANIGGVVDPLMWPVCSEVHCFEPGPGTFKELQKRVGDKPNVILNRLALSDKIIRVERMTFRNAWTLQEEGAETLALSPGAMRDGPEGSDEPFSVRFTTLDAYVFTRNLARMDLVKLDVDGYEHRVLLGGQTSFARWRPPIHFELSFLPNTIGDDCIGMLRYIFDVMDYVVLHQRDCVCVASPLSVREGQVDDTPEKVLENFPWHTSIDVWLVPREKLDAMGPLLLAP